MTLLYTEISHEFPQYGRCVFFAADRRITPLGKGPPEHYKKLVDIPYLNAALGFFGLAEFKRGKAVVRMADHLRAFIRNESGTPSLALLAAKLADSLNVFVPPSLRSSQRSGIHLAGVASGSLPEFWFVRNVDDAGVPNLGQYRADEQYLGRDARAEGFDGRDPNTLPEHGSLYRNGDIVAHVAAWKALDDSLGALLAMPIFADIRSPEKYADWIRFKMKVVIYFHKRFARTLLVGGPVDVLFKRQRGA